MVRRVLNLLRACNREEARRLAERLEVHRTSGDGTWLDMAEIELSVFGRRRTRRRFCSEATPGREASALDQKCDQAAAGAWRSPSHDTRRRFRCEIPSHLER